MGTSYKQLKNIALSDSLVSGNLFMTKQKQQAQMLGGEMAFSKRLFAL
jgi:hypothetical protein